MFEHKSQPLLSRKEFLSRSITFIGFAFFLLLISLLAGMAGYRYFAHINWVDSFYNASMILAGMGPGLDIASLPLELRPGVKLFAGFYGLYSGVVFLAASGLAISPLLHRFFHKMHMDVDD
jgi:hypothetical protein